MKLLQVLFFLLISLTLHGSDIDKEVNEFIRKLDGDFKERKEASEQLKNLPVEYYPFLEKILKEKKNLSLEVKLRLSKEQMVPLRARWLLLKRKEWIKVNILDAYQKHGHKHSKWDKDLTTYFEQISTLLENYVFPAENEDRMRLGQKILRKGCSDPLFIYYFARYVKPFLEKSHPNQLREIHKSAYQLLMKSQYHPYFKFRIARLMSHYNNRDDSSPGYRKDLLKSIELFKDLIKDKSIPFKEEVNNGFQICLFLHKSGLTLDESFNHIMPTLEKAYGPNSCLKDAIMGFVYETLYSESDNNSSSRDEYRKKAVHYLTQAWEKDPARVELARQLLILAHNDRNETQLIKWHNNLLLAQPDSYTAYHWRIEFHKYNSDGLLKYANELNSRGGPMLRRVPGVVNYIANRKLNDLPKYIFEYDFTYKNEELWSITEKALDNYVAEVNDHVATKFTKAYYAAEYGFWDKAHKLFEEAGDISSYDSDIGLIYKESVAAAKVEAEIYSKKNIKAAKPHYLNFKERIKNQYESKAAQKKYDFPEFYKNQNDDADAQTLEVLETISKRYYGDPELTRNIVKAYQEPYEYIGTQIKKGRKDALLYYLWSEMHDRWLMSNEDHLFKAALQLQDSQYPEHLKFTVACKGISSLVKYKKNKDVKQKALMLLEKIKDLSESGDLEDFLSMIEALAKLKALNPKSIKSLSEKFASHEKKAINAYTMYWSSNRRKRMRLKAKNEMIKAWYEDPLSPTLSYYCYKLSNKEDKDYLILQRRAAYTNLDSNRVIKEWFSHIGNTHAQSINCAEFPNLYNQYCLLVIDHSYEHAAHHKNDPNVLRNHWSLVAEYCNKYLKKFPNDSETRSRLALFAIDCGKNDIAAEHLKILGRFAIAKEFDGKENLEKIKSDLLKGNDTSP